MNKTESIFSKYQLPFFFLSAYLLSWWSAPVANGQIIPHGPALAALIVLAVTAGRQGLGGLWRRITKWRVAWYWYLIGPAIIIGYQGIAFVLNLLLGATVASLPRISLATVIELLLLGGFWEEIGWSGYALPKLQAHFSKRPHGQLVAALVLGVFRSIWHLPLFLYGHIPWFEIFVFNFAFQLLITWVFNKSDGSVLVVMLLHFTSNIIGSFMYPVFTGSALTSYYILFMGLACLISLVIVWKSGPALGKRDYPSQHAVSLV